MPALQTLAKCNIYTQPDGICQLCWIQLPGLKCSGCLLEFVCFWEYLHLWYIIYNRTNGSFEIIICFTVLMTTNCICDLQGSFAMIQRYISTENSLIFASQLAFWYYEVWNYVKVLRRRVQYVGYLWCSWCTHNHGIWISKGSFIACTYANRITLTWRNLNKTVPLKKKTFCNVAMLESCKHPLISLQSF